MFLIMTEDRNAMINMETCSRIYIAEQRVTTPESKCGYYIKAEALYNSNVLGRYDTEDDALMVLEDIMSHACEPTYEMPCQNDVNYWKESKCVTKEAN